MRRVRGFTLIELLVVVAIIALLIAILLPALAKAKDATKRSVCAAQLKGQGTGLAIYCAQYKGHLPDAMSDVPGSITLFGDLWDTGYNPNNNTGFAEALIGSASSSNLNSMGDPTSARRYFYCPSGVDNQNNLWSPGGFFHRVLGYCYLNDRLDGNLGLASWGPPDNNVGQGTIHRASSEPYVFHDTMDEPSASDEEVATDIISYGTPNPSIATTYVPNGPSYAGVSTIAWTTGSTLLGNFNCVNHMAGKKPQGANILALDGSVTWRKWSDSAVNWMNEYVASFVCPNP
jgi:prepilin-type N-terminal cleavage/methylation domain-containing protein